MKKFIYLLFLLTFITSCDTILNVEPKSSVTTSNMWVDENDAKGAMYGMYRQFRQAMNTMFVWGDIRTGFYRGSYTPQNLELFENAPNASSAGTNWVGLYTTINDANLILKYVPDINFANQDEKNNVLANAHFIRAISYFYIAKIWGDAPLLLEGFESAEQEGLFPDRTLVSEIFAQIDDDIESALELIQNSASSRIFASRTAINMLKTDYHLWMAKTQGGGIVNLESAKEAVDEVLSSNFELSNSYENVFRNDENNEIIFAIRFERDEGPSNNFGVPFLLPYFALPHDSLANNPLQYGSHTQNYILTEEHENFIYEVSSDIRAYINYAVYTFDDQIFRWINKHLGEFTEGTRYFNSDTKFYRYAEALLFKAEVENALGNTSEALLFVNEIAERAYGMENYYSDGYSQNELDIIILDERLKEFSTEGKAWFDLIRFDQAFKRIWSLQGRESEQHLLLWPVNQTSLNLNRNLRQTSGY